MIENHRLALIIPFFNEAQNITEVIQTIPEYVDVVILVNDGSTDNSHQNVLKFIDKKSHQIDVFDGKAEDLLNQFADKNSIINSKTFFILHHASNKGKGAGIKTGYEFALNLDVDCIATIDGDGQMALEELINLCLPILKNEADYTKGNRLAHPNAKEIIPKVRLMGIYFLTYLTRWCSGYQHIQDTQSGYTAINPLILKQLDIHSIYDRYGYVNDIIVKLSFVNAKILDVPIIPIYKIDRKSKMNIWVTMPKITLMMIRLFMLKWRTNKVYKSKYISKDVKV